MAETERTIEVTGANVEAAIAAGLERLGVERDAVEVEVLDQGSRGLFGLGGREARVRLNVRLATAAEVPIQPLASIMEAPRHAAAEKDEGEIARNALSELLTQMGIEKAEIDLRYAEAAPDEKPRLVLNVHGADAGTLIGHRGETLAALQHIVRLIVGQQLAKRVDLIVDVEGFKARREESLRRLARRMAEQAMRTGRTVALEPMPPNERRIIHLALRDHPQVSTESVGEGDRRKVTIIPKR